MPPGIHGRSQSERRHDARRRGHGDRQHGLLEAAPPGRALRADLPADDGEPAQGEPAPRLGAHGRLHGVRAAERDVRALPRGLHEPASRPELPVPRGRQVADTRAGQPLRDGRVQAAPEDRRPRQEAAEEGHPRGHRSGEGSWLLSLLPAHFFLGFRWLCFFRRVFVFQGS